MSFLFLFLSLVSATPTQTTTKLGPVVVSETLPSFGAFRLNDEYISLNLLQAQQKTVIISYFTTWCAPCRVGIPIIEKITKENPDVIAVYINLSEKSAPVKAMVRDLNIENMIVMDKHQSIAKRHGVVVDGQETVLPRTFVMNKNGMVTHIFTVEGDDFATELQKAVNSHKESTQIEAP